MKNRKTNKIRIISGTWKRRLISVLNLNDLRPSPDKVRETLFNWLRQKLTNCVCVDLFAGSGILGFEAASRGANLVVMIEKNKLIYHQLLLSAQSLQANNISILLGNSLQISDRLPANFFDLAFIDPPFKSDILFQAIEKATGLLKCGGLLYVEAPQLLADRLHSCNHVLQRTHHGQSGKVFYHLFQLTKYNNQSDPL